MVRHCGLIVSTSVGKRFYQIIKDQGSYVRDYFEVGTEAFEPHVDKTLRGNPIEQHRLDGGFDPAICSEGPTRSDTVARASGGAGPSRVLYRSGSD